MAEEITRPGRLIAVDGSRGKDVVPDAHAIVTSLKSAGVECAISHWDASGLFGELAASARGDRQVSVRTLSLVYAADLAFRLRWEIRPVLEAGGVVIAAPYVETAVAFGASAGLAEEWLRELLRFAPAADLRGRASERKISRPWKRRVDRGYAEYCAAMLEAPDGKGGLSKAARREMMTRLDQARGRKSFDLGDKGRAAIVKAITDSRKDGSRRSTSRPRTGHK